MNIFVFGSNLAGRHGKGAALEALKNHGAIYGQGYGFQGQSFAIPTKDEDLKTLFLSEIQAFVHTFIMFTHRHPELVFLITPIGCGLAGYTPKQIAPMFQTIQHQKNISLPQSFIQTYACTN